MNRLEYNETLAASGRMVVEQQGPIIQGSNPSGAGFRDKYLPFELLKYTMQFLEFSCLNNLGHVNQRWYKEIFKDMNISSPCLDRKTSRFIAALAQKKLDLFTAENPFPIGALNDANQEEARWWGLKEVPRNELLGYKILPSYFRHLIVYNAKDCGKLGDFTELFTLIMSETNAMNKTITDAHFSQVISFAKTLQLLRILDTSLITDIGLQPLAQLTALKELCIKTPNITNVGLNTLANLTNLQSLSIARCKITSFGFLKKLTALQELTFIACDDMPVANMAQNIPQTTTLLHLTFECMSLKEHDLGQLKKLNNLVVSKICLS